MARSSRGSGVSYDVQGDRDLVFFGGAGRYYDRQLFIQGVIEELQNSTRQVDLHFCPGGGPAQGTGTGLSAANCAQWVEALRDPDNLRAFAQNAFTAGGLSGGAVWVLNNKTKMPYSDQFNLGVRKRFGRDPDVADLLPHPFAQYSDVRACELLRQWLVHAG